MDKEFKKIDELYRAELGGALTEAPSFVKVNIDKALGFEKHKRGFFLLSLLSLIMLGGVAALWIHFSEPSKPFSKVAADSFTQSQLPVSKKGELALILPNSSSPTHSSDITSTLVNSNNNQPNSSNSAENNATGNIQNQSGSSLQQSSQVDERYTPGIKTNQTQFESIGNTAISGQSNNGSSDNQITLAASTNDMTQKSEDVNDQINKLIKEDQTKINTSDKTNLTAEKLNESDLTAKSGQGEGPTNNDFNSDVQSEDKLAANENDTSTTLLAVATNDTLFEIDLSGLPEADEIIDDPKIDEEKKEELEVPNALATTIDPKLESDYKPMMISVTSGLNWVKSSYLSKDMTEKTFYDNSTKELLGNQTNIDFTYRLKNGLTFGTGLGYIKHEEEYDFSTAQSSLDTIKVIDFIYDDTTIVDSVISYDIIEKQSIKQYVGSNRATYLTIPVHLGTQILWKKFQVDIFASARFNFLLRSSGGYIVDKEYFVFDNTNTIYKRRYVDLMLGTKLHYNFYKNLYVTGAIKYRPVIGTSYTDLVSFDKSFDYLHFGLGLSLKL